MTIRRVFVFALLLGALPHASSESVIPPTSAIGAADTGLQRVLINPMESGTAIHKGAWKMSELFVEPAEGVKPKVGRTALALGTRKAEIAGAKGDFSVGEAVPGEMVALGMWAYLDADANVDRLGLQVYDNEGEALLGVIPADWMGWRWVEMKLSGPEMRQAYEQKDKSGRVDFPVKSVHVAWFTKTRGKSTLVVDAVTALTKPAGAPAPDMNIELDAPERFEPGQSLPASLFATNFQDRPIDLTVRYSLQRDSALYSEPLPDPKFGSNHAAGAKSWLEYDGKVVNDSSSTDDKVWTAPGTNWRNNHFTEAFQYVDLGRPMTIRKMTWQSGDANHSWFVDVFASEDGKEYSLVPGLENVDHYEKWGLREFPLRAPFRARFLKFRYHTGGKKQPIIRFPSELGVYDGAGDEVIALPEVGPTIKLGTVALKVPARSFACAELDLPEKLGPGAYILAVEAKGAETVWRTYKHAFGSLVEVADLVTSESRLAVNSSRGSLAPELSRLGVGWVRYENMKWPFVSPSEHRYAFDGSVAPWYINTDRILQEYADAGLSVLPYMFMTPAWCSSVPQDAPNSMKMLFPPNDLSLFGEFCFQVAGRYGHNKVPANLLLTDDKKSGLGLLRYYEMWNEPNLNPTPKATWGPWAAPMDTYYEMMRHGAKAVKRADPTAIVTTAGYAGIQVQTVDRLRTYKYPDGKCPLDFVDVINVHYYSGQEPPETALRDTNTNVSGAKTFIEMLAELRAWRDRYAPTMPIWMTETGYDSAGPFGTTEAIQAARLPRVVMLCLAYGVEKVFVYRESGSRPSKHACSGLLRDDLSQKPSWYTYGTLIRQFKGVEGGARRLPHPDENVWLLGWQRQGAPLLTAWTVEEEVELGMELGPCRITDAFGGVTDVDSTRRLKLTPFPQYIDSFSESALAP